MLLFESHIQGLISFTNLFNDLLELAADIDLAAEFVEAGATLVIKVAQEVEAIAHVAELSATEAEALAIKVTYVSTLNA